MKKSNVSLTGKVIVKKKEIANTSIMMKLALILLKLVYASNSSEGKDILVDVYMIREGFVFVDNPAHYMLVVLLCAAHLKYLELPEGRRQTQPS